MLMLGGSMMPYVWTINGAVWDKHSPIMAKTGERVLLGGLPLRRTVGHEPADRNGMRHPP